MALEEDLQVFLCRTASGSYRLEAADGSMVIQSRTYRQLREDLQNVVKTLQPPRRVTVVIGSLRRAGRARPEADSRPQRLPAD